MNPPIITNQQALMNLYSAARQASLNAEAHEVVKNSALQLEAYLASSTLRPEAATQSPVIPFPVASK